MTSGDEEKAQLQAWREKWEADSAARKAELEEQAEKALATRRAQEQANEKYSPRPHRKK